MSNFVQALKQYHLLETYLALPAAEKQQWEKYFPQDCDCSNCQSGQTKTLPLNSPARILWMTAANALPHNKYEFAETLLNKAMEIAKDNYDAFWIHANLAQLYYDQLTTSETALEKCKVHCEALYKMGLRTPWIKQMRNDLKNRK